MKNFNLDFEIDEEIVASIIACDVYEKLLEDEIVSESVNRYNYLPTARKIIRCLKATTL